MSDTPFKNQCLEIFDRLEKQHKQVFARLDTLSEEQLHFNPAPEKWNILQVIFHVMTGERLSVLYIKRKTGSGKEIPKSGLRAKIRLFLVKLAFLSPFKFKAPEMTDATGKDPEYEKLKSDWQKIREDLKTLIEELDDKTLKSELFKHPRVGMMNMKQALEFMRTHSVHHAKQIRHLMNQPYFPGGE